MKILFCDDNWVILSMLQKLVMDFFASFSNLQPDFAVFTSGDELLACETSADIAFLDVEMPGISGIQVSAKLKQKNPSIKIFIVTAFPDYLDEAMRVQVFRYLSKPIDKNRLFRNLKDALYQYNMESRAFPIVSNDGIATRRAEEIVCVETSGRKVQVYATDSVFTSIHNMEYWRQALTLPCFFVPHRSYVINMRFVHSVGKDTIWLKYGNTEKLVYLTRRKYTQFKDTYLLYLEKSQ